MSHVEEAWEGKPKLSVTYFKALSAPLPPSTIANLHAPSFLMLFAGKYRWDTRHRCKSHLTFQQTTKNSQKAKKAHLLSHHIYARQSMSTHSVSLPHPLSRLLFTDKYHAPSTSDPFITTAFSSDLISFTDEMMSPRPSKNPTPSPLMLRETTATGYQKATQRFAVSYARLQKCR